MSKMECPICKEERTYHIDPFNGEICCDECKGVIGNNPSEGPIAKYAKGTLEEHFFTSPLKATNPEEKFEKWDPSKEEPLEEFSVSQSKTPTSATKKIAISISLWCIIISLAIWYHHLSPEKPEKASKLTSSSSSKSKKSSQSNSSSQKNVNTNSLAPLDVARSLQKMRIKTIKKNLPAVVVVLNFTRNNSGTGFIIDKQGHVVTNEHVISGAELVKVKLYTGQQARCSIIGYDIVSDLAILKIMNFDLYLSEVNIASWEEDDKLVSGTTILALGHPGNLWFTAFTGIISYPNRYQGTSTPRKKMYNTGYFNNWIQVEAPINFGNSGGPLFNLDGKVIGVNTRKSGHMPGIAFSIPASYAKGIVNRLILYQKITRSTMGILWLPTPNGGVRVWKTLPKSPAAKANIQEGDVVYKIGRNNVYAKFKSHIPTVCRIEAEQTIGAEVKLSIERRGVRRKIKIVPEPRQNFHNQIMFFSKLQFWGIPLSDTLQKYLSAQAHYGIWVCSIEKGSPLEQGAVFVGDILVGIDQNKFISDSHFLKIYKGLGGKKKITLILQKGLQTRQVQVKTHS